MAVPDRTNVPLDTQLTEQYALNRTFDPEFNVMAVELLGWDKVANALRRIEVEASPSTPGSYVISSGAQSGLVPDAYDTVQITSYNANNDPLIVVYRLGGAAGTIVATLTITYDGSNNITQVVRT